MTITSVDQLDLSKQYTFSDYLKWKITDRLELIRGYVRQMAAPSREHQDISRNLNHFIDMHFWGKSCSYYTAPFDVRFPRFDTVSQKEIITIVQPDICVICDEKKLDKKGCLGAPDLIIEILSPGNSKKEMREKFEIYEESGVKEYWIVNVMDKNVLIYTLNEIGKFIGQRPFVEDEIMNSFVFPELSVDLNQVFV
jgi:Uma2 family endonuclease